MVARNLRLLAREELITREGRPSGRFIGAHLRNGPKEAPYRLDKHPGKRKPGEAVSGETDRQAVAWAPQRRTEPVVVAHHAVQGLVEARRFDPGHGRPPRSVREPHQEVASKQSVVSATSQNNDNHHNSHESRCVASNAAVGAADDRDGDCSPRPSTSASARPCCHPAPGQHELTAVVQAPIAAPWVDRGRPARSAPRRGSAHRARWWREPGRRPAPHGASRRTRDTGAARDAAGPGGRSSASGGGGHPRDTGPSR